MDSHQKTPWEKMTYDEKNRELYRRQTETLDMLLAHKAISRAQYDKSLHDLTEKMGIKP